MIGVQTNRYLCQSLSTLPAFIGGTLRLNRGYRGPILNVYNGTTTSDVWSVNEIAAFCGGSDGFVDKIYDQSGHGRDFTAISSSTRPKIYTGSTATLLRTNTFGPIVMRFDGSDDALTRSDACGLSGAVGLTVFHLGRTDTTISGGYSYWGPNSFGNTFSSQYINNIGGSGKNTPRITGGSCNDVHFDDSSFAGTKTNAYHYDVLSCPPNGDGHSFGWRLNGTDLAREDTGVITLANTSFLNTASGIGVRAGNSFPLTGDLSVVAMWSPVLSAADVSALEKWAEMWRTQ